MKKIFTLLTACTFAIGANAQDDQKLQMGIATSAGMNFNKSGSKLLKRNGLGSELMIGFNVQYNFTPTISLLTGIEFEFEKFKYKYAADSNMFYNYNGDSQIYTKKDMGLADDPITKSPVDARLFRIEERTQKPVIIYIPTMLTFRTSEIGPLRYFGRFGLRSGLVVKSAINDKGSLYKKSAGSGVPDTLETPNMSNKKMLNKKDLLAFRSYLGIAGGVMWNFSGSTTLIGEIGYYYGITQIHSKTAITGDEEKNQSLFTRPSSTKRNYFQPKATQGQLVLKVSILF